MAQINSGTCIEKTKQSLLECHSGDVKVQAHDDLPESIPSDQISCSILKENNVSTSGNVNMKVEENTQSTKPSICSHSCLRVSSKHTHESQIIYLLCELEEAKKTNKNLKKQLKAITAELNALKVPSQVHSNRYSPGMLTAMISEVYQAQHERDDALMARIRLANDERDEALYRLDEINEKLNSLSCDKSRDEFTQVNIDDQTRTKIRPECLNESDYILNNQDVLLRDVERKKVKDQLNSTQPKDYVGSKPEDEEIKGETSFSTNVTVNSEVDCEMRVKFLEHRLLEEIQAKEEAQMSCRKLERLVAVLRKKVNGFGLRGQGSSDESRESSPLMTVQKNVSFRLDDSTSAREAHKPS